MRPAIVLWPTLILLVGVGCSKAKEPSVDERIAGLLHQVDRQKWASPMAIRDYKPKLTGRLDDLANPAADILRQLPGVVDVEVLVQPKSPTHRLVHLRDWHYLPPDLAALDIRQAADKHLSDEEVDALYREFILQVELVQLQQIDLLRCLIRHHGLKRVLAEGLTPKGMGNYRDIILAFRRTEDGLAAFERELRDIHHESPDLDQGVGEIRLGHQRKMLEYGAAAQLAVAREVQVLPLDDDELLDQADPVTPEGEIRLNPERVEARRDAQVKSALASGPVSVIILGGDHDLSASIKRLGKGRVEYIRVMTGRYRSRAAGRPNFTPGKRERGTCLPLRHGGIL
jgi:hypothetical protein